ncbi:MAG: hypothetical protein LUI14_11275 [Lachnospiraceae bacterium]|nr:hypothetical protein [Lachnospiraceae bacterium]
MKGKSVLKKAATILTAAAMATGSLTVCGTTVGAAPADSDGGKILYLSNINSGVYYDYYKAFYERICADLGYDFEIIYGDPYNDPNGNLTAVRNAYTDDVVGLITTQDGGIESIMDEYPDMYVSALGTDMDSVFDEDGTNHGALEKDHFLAVSGDMFTSGEEQGQYYAQQIIDGGYKKVATVLFPSYAYPSTAIADQAFRDAIEEYNQTADEKIEIVGETTVLDFTPLDASFFLEEGYGDLDAIVGLCAGIQFIYPTMVVAKADGTCDQKTQLITNGYEYDADILADCGDDKTIKSTTITNPEAAFLPIALIDNAIQGKQYADYPGAENVEPGIITVDSTSDFEVIKEKFTDGQTLLENIAVSVEELEMLLIRNNPDATYAALVEAASTETMESYLE